VTVSTKHALLLLHRAKRTRNDVARKRLVSEALEALTEADKKEDTLLLFCRQFVASQNITCAESVYQTDRVIEAAYGFIEGVCDIVGYAPDEDEG
jgi:hypothetical protein